MVRSKVSDFAYQIRKIILQQAKKANVGHIGSALSIADIIAALYGNILIIPDPESQERDRFVLSKGHAALALYAVLFLKGWITRKHLDSYCTDGSVLGVHPEHVLRGVDFSTGSLGLGLSMAAGVALAERLRDSQRRVFVLVSDAECNEGSLWEAVMFASHYELSNLIVIIDLNGQQAFGYTKEVLNLTPMVSRWNAFGWNAHEVNGHDTHQIIERINNLKIGFGAPNVVIAHTIFGKGVSFMEGKIEWHYLPMSDREYRQALHDIKNI